MSFLLSLMCSVSYYHCVQLLSFVQLFETPWTIACQAPLSMGFSRQEYWSGLLFLPPGDLPDPEIGLASPALAGRFFTTASAGRPGYVTFNSQKVTSVAAISLHIHLVQTRDPGTHHSPLPAAQGPDHPALHTPQDPLVVTSHSWRIRE